MKISYIIHYYQALAFSPQKPDVVSYYRRAMAAHLFRYLKTQHITQWQTTYAASLTLELQGLFAPEPH
jgi:hypothetical protein